MHRTSRTTLGYGDFLAVELEWTSWAALDPLGVATLLHRRTRKEDVWRLQAAPLLVGDGYLMVLDSHARGSSFVQAKQAIFLPLVAQ